MNSSENNLLTLLHRWAPRQDENFTTEAFAHLLRHLLSAEPEAGAGLLNQLAGSQVVTTDQTSAVAVKTQLVSALGRPDIEVRAPGLLLLIEAKVEAGLTGDQLARYRRLLAESRVDKTVLVLLTHYPLESDDASSQPDVSPRWYQIADWLLAMLEKKSLRRAESKFLVGQFHDFLRSRSMTMEQVGWELKAGVQSFISLMQMVGEAIAGQKEWCKRAPSSDWYGYWVRDRKGWVGVNYDNPTVLFFQSYQVPVEATSAEMIGNGFVKEASDSPNGLRWQIELDLGSEEVHFFARPRASQMLEIEKLIKQGFHGLDVLTKK